VRILITSDPMLPVPPKLYGGIERIIDSLVVGLRERRHEVALLAHPESTCSATAKFAWPDHPGALGHIRRMRKAVASFEPDVVHSFSRLAYLFPLYGNRRLPKIMSFQREPTVRTVRWANRFARGSLSFTGCSEYISGKGRKAGGQWQTVHNFVDLDRYRFVPEVAGEAPLVFLSRVEPIKGAHLAIEACRRAGRKLIMAGNHSEANDEEAAYWRDMIKPQVDGRTVEYVGSVNDTQKDELLGRAAALIVPIQWDEPFGIVFAEALACGTPVISCPRGALPEIVRPGIDGFLGTTIAELVAFVAQLGELSRGACRARAEEAFSGNVIVPQYEELYSVLAHSVSLNEDSTESL
jgi:glycosyltransferase involved in cell wall biosynthesis